MKLRRKAGSGEGWLRLEPLGAVTAVSFVNVLRLLIIRAPCVPDANINEVSHELRRWITEEFSHSAGPQLELGWGPGRAKRARARPSFDLLLPVTSLSAEKAREALVKITFLSLFFFFFLK